ncbi:putative quinol monooxygenase [Fictibacillus norfolkensis]|jgi:quinol monooxygenase YgiN|uniref:Antibiotic biosynthesis monooxygenase n=1 Tax=Fictibacillus norfolkensis TaxID=2762233 RepID=A0ABR8SKA6_9BACL|nr:putative quinol monooxygenase [Fictibacillus norfolkensis]MBD7963554.1 antibiotic biosynthesis monooxygenase [Fictibacillus norfolkensis]
MIIIHAGLTVQKEKEEAFLTEVKTLIEASRAESGNIQYDLKKDTEKEATYMMVEVWENQEAVQNHNTSEHFVAFGKKAQSFMAAPTDVKVYAGEQVK